MSESFWILLACDRRAVRLPARARRLLAQRGRRPHDRDGRAVRALGRSTPRGSRGGPTSATRGRSRRASGAASSLLAPVETRYARSAMVSCSDHVATGAGVAMLRAGGSAADAALAASAVLAVTWPQHCGPGGDLFALVHVPGEDEPAVLNASGRAGAGADPERLREAGESEMPLARRRARGDRARLRGRLGRAARALRAAGARRRARARAAARGRRVRGEPAARGRRRRAAGRARAARGRGPPGHRRAPAGHRARRSRRSPATGATASTPARSARPCSRSATASSPRTTSSGPAPTGSRRSACASGAARAGPCRPTRRAT